MARYTYKGRTARGELVRGRMDGESAEAVAARLADDGIVPVDIAAFIERGASGASADLVLLARRLGIGRPKTADLIHFARQMYTITKSGIPLLRGMHGLVATTHNAALRDALGDVVASLESGRDLASSLSRHPRIFPPLFVSIVAVGEATGTLESAFQRLGEHLAQERDIQSRVAGALRYPLIVVLAISIAVGILTTYVIPRFAPLFRVLGNDIPWPTRVIMGASQFAQHDGFALLGVLAALALAVQQYVSTPAGRYRWHEMKLRLPVTGLLAQQAALARLTRTLSVTLAAGMPMLQALAIIGRTAGNDVMAAQTGKLREAVERGEPLSRAASATGLFPPLVLQMIAIGEETGELAELLAEVAGFYEREVNATLESLSAAIEPLLIVVIGAMVLVLALGVFLPMWEMIAKVGGGA